tara:strand:+ start:14655 stop:15398 length:744 start_codon:yes stop_codon:yes gene_type:complete
MAKERFQNPVVGDDVTLRFYTYNSNNLSAVDSITQVEIYVVDDTLKAADNPQGLRLCQTIDSTDVVSDPDSPGEYSVVFTLDSTCYGIGNYVDRWFVSFETSEPIAEIDNFFQIFPDMWYTDTTPIVYDFNFNFRPNRLRQGSKQFLMIEITPNIPTASDLQRYYENLAIVATVCISIELACGPCLPEEKDLRLVVDEEQVTIREKNRAFYQLDTEDLDCGMYNVWFRLDFGGNLYLSDKMQLQIYE